MGTPPLAAVAAALRTSGGLDDGRAEAQLDIPAPAAARSLVVARLLATRVGNDPLVVVTATSREAEALAEELGDYVPPSGVAVFPAWETLPHERLSPRGDTVGQRLACLRRIEHPDKAAEGPIDILVVPVRSLIQPIVAGLGDLEPITLAVGDEMALENLAAALVRYGYTRAELVDRRGEFAVRGGIVDVFPPTAEHPVRLEFFGDTLEDVRSFAASDQRSLEPLESGLLAPPCRELLLTPEVRHRAAELAEEHPGVADLLEKVAAGTAPEGMESLSFLLVPKMELLVEVVPSGSRVLLCDPERISARAKDLLATDQEFLEASWTAAATGGESPVDVGGGFRSLGDVRGVAAGRGLAWWSTSPFEQAPADSTTDAGETLLDDVVSVRLGIVPAPEFRGNLDAAAASIRQWLAEQWVLALTAAGSGTLERMGELLDEHDIPHRMGTESETAAGTAGLAAGVVTLLRSRQVAGFLLPEQRLALLTERDLTGRSSAGEAQRARMPARRRNQIDLAQLAVGDYVVHDQHGVGRYVEMTRRRVSGSDREYLVVEYAAGKRGHPADRLFVPTDQLHMLTRYVGGDSPSLDRIGGSDWAKRKSRARKAVKEIAAELIKLYAARQAAPGRAFGPDTPWQTELEDAFPFVETRDQLSTINDVKADMERTVPMDRVIAGDVGYGKTEIAVRAAFKAVQDGAQVAVLVPTTLLVQQHLTTFSERYAPFPIVVKALSRFQTDSEVAAVRAGVADGTVDVVIGTHRLISGEVSFKDLGLVIVDEEQRFGVEHKEKLKQIRSNVDVLTMSATPIPRTLEMSVTGIRDMSTIATPPEERHPVLTYVGARNDKRVAAAIRREVLREGQVFYVHNRVDTIEKAAARLQDLVPEARIVTAHGQMSEHVLEEAVDGFWRRESDVLVCTTIVETGLDIANANTLIVERADLLGLAQLHQLRGRVGRGRERAYAYFLFPPERTITQAAHDRLATIAQHSELGAGMAVAMKDLEIRGAGNLLGGEQSGHIADVGFDLYVRMVGEAVEEYKTGAVPEQPTTRIDLPVPAHLPHEYVSGERLRLEVYRRISEASDEAAIADIQTELVDRFGEPDEPVGNLLDIARFRVRAAKAGVHEVVVQGKYVRFAPVRLADWQAVRLKRLYTGAVVKSGTDAILVPRPKERSVGGAAITGPALLAWADRVVNDVVAAQPPGGGATSSGR